MTGEEGRSEREQRREERRAERDAQRAERRAEREERRAERHRIRAEMHTHLGDLIRERIQDEVRLGLGAKRWHFGLGGHGVTVETGGEQATEVVERRFEISGMPRLRVSNVSGETEISVGSANEVLVRARKRVRGWSEDRARRLLENVEVRMEQDGDEIVVEPRLFQQERGWIDLFRGGRVAVDLEIRLPRESHVEATTVSGELSVTGTRGQHEIRTVSGDVSIDDVQGPLHVRSVSGDINVTAFSGRVEANSTSGEIEFARSRVRTPDVVAVSGDVAIESVLLQDEGEGRVKTVSGDVELVIAQPDAEIGYTSLSGDAVVEVAARVEKTGKRDRLIVIGAGGPRLRVKTVSGDLKLRRAEDGAVAQEEHAAAEAMPMSPPAPPAPPAPAAAAAAREILARVATGELSVDDAAALLDEARRR